MFGITPEQGMSTYLNSDEFKAAFHIKSTSPSPWTDCADIKYPVVKTTGSIDKYTNYLNTKDIDILHYSGDTDGCVPTLGTINWITNAGVYSVTKEWAPVIGAD